MRGYTHTECCDCALVHKEEFRVVDGHIEWRAVRDDKATEKRRKELGIKITKK
jgi:transcription initiation factor TFIIIB Brf1 subunit/transcription initiation factor TFIIB